MIKPIARSARALSALVILGVALFAGGQASAATLEEVTDFGANPGNLQFYKYVPDNLRPNAPLVLVLHGCLQTAATIDAETGWTKYADKWGFAVAFPQQNLANNYAGCFNWFFTFNQMRDAYELGSIKSMVDYMVDTHGLNDRRVYAAGLSAGGATVSNLLAAYPDVFRAGAIVAGVPHGCATDVNTGVACMFGMIDQTPQALGDKVRATAGDYDGPWPRVSVWHGDMDEFVNVMNANEIVEQWTNVHGIDQTADIEYSFGGYNRAIHLKNGWIPVVESYIIPGMTHGWSVDPGNRSYECGEAGPYIIDTGVCTTFHIAKNWVLMF